MKTCALCTGKVPLVNTGKLLIKVNNADESLKLQDRLEKAHINYVMDDMKMQISYPTWENLQRQMSLIQSLFTDSQLNKIEGTLLTVNPGDAPSRFQAPLSQLSLIIENPLLVKVIQEKLFQSYLQPIVQSESGETYGYEFLLRPTSKVYPFSPGDLFMFAQHSGLQSMLDSSARINAIRTGSHMLNKGQKLFINFLPSSIYDPAHCLQSTFQAAKDYNVRSEDLVFEVVETEKIHDVEHLKNIFHHYKMAGVKVALDDIGSGYATLDLLKELKPDYAKIDRSLIRNCDTDEGKIERIKHLRDITERQGTVLLAEGIETEEEYLAVRPYADLVQGYFFGKPMKKPA